MGYNWHIPRQTSTKLMWGEWTDVLNEDLTARQCVEADILKMSIPHTTRRAHTQIYTYNERKSCNSYKIQSIPDTNQMAIHPETQQLPHRSTDLRTGVGISAAGTWGADWWPRGWTTPVDGAARTWPWGDEWCFGIAAPPGEQLGTSAQGGRWWEAF